MKADAEFPPVSVLIISKGRRALLSEALKSIAAVDYPKEKVQVVVVEDTVQPLPPPGVVYISEDFHGKGRSLMRNVSVRASTVEILAFTDDDVVMDPAWLKELVKPLLDHPDVAGVGGAVLPKNSTLLGLCEYVLGYPGGGLRYTHAAAGKLVETRYLSTVNCAYRRPALLEAGGFHPQSVLSGEDYILSREVAKRYRCLFNPRAVVYHEPVNLWRLFARFVNFGRGEMELLGFTDDRLSLVRLMMRESLGLKYLGFLLLLLLANVNPLWILVVAAAHYGYLIFSYRFITRYIPRRDVLLAVPAVRFVSDLGMDWGRVRGLVERLLRGLRG